MSKVLNIIVMTNSLRTGHFTIHTKFDEKLFTKDAKGCRWFRLVPRPIDISEEDI